MTDNKRPYPWRAGAQGLMLLAVLCACSKDPVGLETPAVPESPDTPITFSGDMQDQPSATRSTNLEEHVSGFHVWGYKNMSQGGSGYGGLQTVMYGYQVSWMPAVTSITSTYDWEYVELGNGQTVKYWDMTAAAYRFFAVTGDYVETNSTTATTVSSMASYGSNYCNISMTADASSAETCAEMPYYSHLWFSTGNLVDYPDKQFGHVVRLEFMQPYAQVRILFTYVNASDEATTVLTDISFKPTDTGAKIQRKGRFTVSYPLTGTATEESWSVSTVDAEAALAAITEPATSYCVLPADQQEAYILSATVNGTAKSVVVPAEYMSWQPGYGYTYRFKIMESGSGIVLDGVQMGFKPWSMSGEQNIKIYNW